MPTLRNTLDSLPRIVTLLLVIFLNGIYGAVYRIARGDIRWIITGVL